MPQLKTAAEMRGFLADVLIGIKTGEIDANKANAIAKVAAQINQSMTTEVQTRLRLKELGEPASGSMMLGDYAETPPAAPIPTTTEPQKNITEKITLLPDPVPATSLEVATANYRLSTADRENVWCDQCDMNVTVSQAVSCKSRYCKAKEAA